MDDFEQLIDEIKSAEAQANSPEAMAELRLARALLGDLDRFDRADYVSAAPGPDWGPED